MTDKNAIVKYSATYYPFGGLLSEEVVHSNELRFPGQYHDRETDLHYNWHREYDPELGRYLQPDPIGLAGGMNQYGYANQNPLSFIDPMGLEDLTEAETNELLTRIGKQSYLGILRNHIFGDYDFKNTRAEDTFIIDGRRVSADVFGNYSIAYAANNAAGSIGDLSVYIGGIFFDAILPDDETGRDWDADSRWDIRNGIRRAIRDRNRIIVNHCEKKD